MTQPVDGSRTPEAAGGNKRAGLAGFAAVIALSAWGGALGLSIGFLSLPATLNERLPFASPVFGGLALALVVALPATCLAWLAWHDDPRTGNAARSVGGLLVGWILVELAFIRDFSFFHPTYLVIGLVLLWIGRRAGRSGPAAPLPAELEWTRRSSR